MMQATHRSISLLVQFWRALVRFIPLQLVGFVAIAALGLTGCVDADVGIRFDSPHKGEIVQQIQFGERPRSLSDDRASATTKPKWTQSIARTAASLGGSVEQTSQDILIRIPFYNSDELEQKFNQFFDSLLGQAASDGAGLPPIDSQLTVRHSNFLLVERDRLKYEVDLRSLGVLAPNGAVLVSPASLISLEFRLKTPWGARSINHSNLLRPRSRDGSHELIWTLVPGEKNTFETIFWLPSPIGIGTVSIVLLILLGRFIRYSQASFDQARST